MAILSALIFFIFAIPQVLAALSDANSMKIPNRIPLIVLAGFLVMVPFTWTGLPDLMEHLMVGLTMFAVGFAMFAFGWMGGGDSKLLAATAFWFTWSDVYVYIAYTGIFGGLLTVFLLLGRKYVPVRILTTHWAMTMFGDEKKIPYGLALAAGAIVTFPVSDMFRATLPM